MGCTLDYPMCHMFIKGQCRRRQYRWCRLGWHTPKQDTVGDDIVTERTSAGEGSDSEEAEAREKAAQRHKRHKSQSHRSQISERDATSKTKDEGDIDKPITKQRKPAVAIGSLKKAKQGKLILSLVRLGLFNTQELPSYKELQAAFTKAKKRSRRSENDLVDMRCAYLVILRAMKGQADASDSEDA